MAITKALYTATATAQGGREGHTSTDDGRLDLMVSVPQELGGPGTGTNPEQLFAAGFASCFHSALKLMARAAKIDVSESQVTVRVGLGPIVEGIGYGLEAHVVVSLPGMDETEAKELVQQADSVCPYSNATRGNIDVIHEITV